MGAICSKGGGEVVAPIEKGGASTNSAGKGGASTNSAGKRDLQGPPDTSSMRRLVRMMSSKSNLAASPALENAEREELVRGQSLKNLSPFQGPSVHVITDTEELRFLSEEKVQEARKRYEELLHLARSNSKNSVTRSGSERSLTGRSPTSVDSEELRFSSKKAHASVKARSPGASPQCPLRNGYNSVPMRRLSDESVDSGETEEGDEEQPDATAHKGHRGMRFRRRIRNKADKEKGHEFHSAPPRTSSHRGAAKGSRVP